jgi:RHS repeat-associated protein
VRGALTGVLLPGGPPVAYVLDPVGHRIGKKVGGALQRGWLWSGIVPVAELGANSEVTARFVFGSRRNVPDYILKGTDRFRFFTDERGSVRLVVNVADGSVAQQLDYDEFGRVLTDTNPGFQPFGFAGGLYDPDTGLVHFGLREYSAETGQWTARDPVLFAGGQTSLYAYVSNDPINRSDPLGTGPFYLANDELAGYAGNVNDFGVGGLGMVATWAGKERLASVINAGGLVAGTVLGGIQVAYSASQTWDAFQGNDQMAQAGAFYGLLGNTFSFGTPLFLYIAQNGATSAGAFATPQMLAGTGASQLSAGQLGARLGLAGLFMTTSVNLAATSIGNAMQGKPTPIDIGADLVGQVLFGLPSQIYGRDCP